MPKLTAAEREQHRTWLSEWCTPNAMAAYVGTVNDKMGSATFFRQAGVEFLRDAWLAAEFGHHRQSTRVRLVSEGRRWPDFEAITDDTVEQVECVEADVPGRRRGEEYRNVVDSEISLDPISIDDCIVGVSQWPLTLHNAVVKKVAKHYAGHASLLIYLNVASDGTKRSQIETAMKAVTTPALPHFVRVWVLWGTQLYGPWEDDAGEEARG